MATKKKEKPYRSVNPEASLQGKEAQPPEEVQTQPKAQAITNLIDDLYFGTAEKTVSDSSYYAASQQKPYNSDDLFQKTNDYSIYEDMMKDDQISVCMNIKKDLVVGSGWDVVCSDDSDLHIQIKEDLEKALCEDPAVPFDDMLEEIISAFEFGFSLSEKVFQNRPDGSLTLKFLKTRHPSTWLIHTDKFGNVERYEQRGTNSSIDIEPKSLIHYINTSKFQNPYGTSDLRAAYNAWFIKRQIVRFYGIFLEKAASPVPIARYDSNVNKEAVEDIYNAIKKFQTKSALAIPKVIELEFLEAKSNGEVFIKGINIFNMFIGRALVIPDLLGFQGAETSGGSYALGKDQIEVLFKHISRRRMTLERMVNKQIIEPLVVYNYGFIDDYPKFKLRPISDAYLIELAKLWIELQRFKVYQPNDEEINHFRSLAKFPEGSVNMPEQSAQLPNGADQQPNGDINGKSQQDKNQEENSNPKAQDKGKSDANAQSQEEGDTSYSRERIENPEGEIKKYKVYDLPSGPYSKKVNFTAIESQMDRFKERITSEALPITKRIFEDLFQQIEQKKIIKDIKPERIDDLKLKYLKDLKLVLKRNLREAYQEGKLGGQKELLKGNFRTPLPNDKFLEVLEAEIYQFIGDWAYSLTKEARISIIEAIRDGKPLSSVIDSLDQDGLDQSNASIERFARTKITDVMNRGRLEFFNDSGVVSAYQYSAVLDDRTTEICRGLHGKIFQSGTEPVPPMHFNCRSLLVPITKYEDFNVSESVGKTPIDQFIEENKGDGFAKR